MQAVWGKAGIPVVTINFRYKITIMQGEKQIKKKFFLRRRKRIMGRMEGNGNDGSDGNDGRKLHDTEGGESKNQAFERQMLGLVEVPGGFEPP